MYHEYERRKKPEIKKNKKKQSPNKIKPEPPPLRRRFQLQKLLGNFEVQRLMKQQELMAKLYTSQPGDIYEKEADKVADKIISMGNESIDNEPVKDKPQVKKIHKKGSSGGGMEVSSKDEAGITSLKGKGQPMGKGLRDYFEPRFGVDLGNVRVHTGSNADKLARAIRARAFTYGNNIAFAKNEYKPETTGGKKLVAHELVHTLQQSGNLQRQETRHHDDRGHEINPHYRYAQEAIKAMDEWYMSSYKGCQGWKVIINLEQIDIIEVLKIIKKYRYQLFYLMKMDIYNKTSASYLKIGEVRRQMAEICIRMVENGDLLQQTDYNIEADNFKTIKDDIYKVDATLIDEFISISGISWKEILLDIGLGLFGWLINRITDKQKINEIDKALTEDSNGDLSVDKLGKAIELFQNRVVNKAETLIINNIKIASEEYIRYQNDEEIKDLFDKVTSYAPSFNKADNLRAKALLRFMKSNDFNRDINSPVFSDVGGGSNYFGLKDIVRSIYSITEEEVAEILVDCSPGLAETVIKKQLWQIENDKRNEIYAENQYISEHLLIIEPREAPSDEQIETKIKTKIETDYTEIKEANDEAEETRYQMISDQDEFPVLADMHIDFRTLSRQYQNDQEGFKAEILTNLKRSIDAGYNTLANIKDDPSVVWKLAPLIKLTMDQEGICIDDNMGKIIWDVVEDTKDLEMLRSVGMAAIGIALGIAGFFTGGSTWAGIALGAGGAIVSGVDLYYEMKSYNLLSNAANAIMDMQISEDPGVLGIVFAIAGLVLDIVDIGVAAAKIGKAADTINTVAKNADNLIEEVTESASKQYDELFEAGDGLKPAVSKDEWVESVVDAVKKNIDEAGIEGLENFDDVANHMFGQGEILRRGKGINGGHLINDFENVIRNQGEILSKTPISGMEGVYKIEYKLYKMERGVITSVLQEGDPFIKTVFDPSIWNKAKLKVLANDLFGSIVIDGTHEVVKDGITFIGWIRNGKLQSFGIK